MDIPDVCSVAHSNAFERTGPAFFIPDIRSVISYLLPPTKEEVNVFASVCLFVCLSVSKITQKLVHGFA